MGSGKGCVGEDVVLGMPGLLTHGGDKQTLEKDCMAFGNVVITQVFFFLIINVALKGSRLTRKCHSAGSHLCYLLDISHLMEPEDLG